MILPCRYFRLAILLTSIAFLPTHQCCAEDDFALHFQQKHLTAKEVYQLFDPQANGGSHAVRKAIGSFVLLDVVVKSKRDVPLVEIVAPESVSKTAMRSSKTPVLSHLVSQSSVSSELKQGQKYRIEGMVVDEGFLAYTIYLYQAKPVK